MSGHGCPSSLCRVYFALLRALMFIALAVPCVAAAADDVPMRVRVAWGGGSARQWQGTVSVSAGSLVNVRPLGMEADEPGSMWIAKDVLHIAQKSSRSYDAFDLDLRVPTSATLTVTLRHGDSAAADRTMQVPISALIADASTHDLDDARNRLIIRRAPGDALHVEFDRSSLVFAPGETFACKVTPRCLPAEIGSRLRYRFQLQEAAGARVLWSQEAEQTAVDGLGLQIPLQVKLPITEGVYDLQFDAYPRRGGLALNLKPQPIATRRVQLVVVSTQPATGGEGSLTTVFEFDPARPQWWERLTNLPALPAARKGPMGTGHTHIWQHPLGTMIQLAPGTDETSPSWEAYPIDLQQVGQPHVVEIEFPSDVPQSLAVSIVEPNSAGAVTAVGLDSGIYVPDEAAATNPTILTHRLVFWPKTKSPLLLLTNLRTGSQAVYGRIRVNAISGRLPSAASHIGGDERLVAGFYDRPLFPENFGAIEVFDSAAGRSLDDWNTFYQGATRLAEYLKFAGYNGLMLSILADGSTIYPADRLQPTPRYDNGAFLSLGQDPVQKDVVELVLRVFDREQLKLVPALNLATPLPELEELKRRSDSTVEGLEWIGRDGRPLTERHRGERGQAPYYNTLHPRVQQAIVDLAVEAIGRYGDHPSLAGIALQLNSEGYLQLPGVAWGFDDHTVSLFEADTEIKIPAEGPNRFAQRATLLLGQHRQAWIAWRAGRMLSFYQLLRDKVVAIRPELKLYLAGTELFKTAELRAALRPTLPPRPLDETLLEIGVDSEQLAQQQGIVLLRPQQLSPPSPRATPLLDLKVNDAAEIDRNVREATTRGTIFYHQPYRQPLPSFDQRGIYRNSQLWLVAQLSPAADRNRQRFVRSLAALDVEAVFDGGWLLNLGQEDAARELFCTLRRLPGGKWKTLSLDCQPLTLRHCTHQDKSYLYIANDSPWPVEATLNFTGEPALSEVTGQRTVRSVWTADGAQLVLNLRPYDLIAFAAPQPSLSVASASVSLPESAALEMQNRIQDFQARLIALKNQPALDAPYNAGFEQTASDSAEIPGWVHNQQTGVTTEIDSQRKHAGTQSMRFSSNGPIGIVASDEFEIPATGRLEVAAWLCVEDDEQPTFRVAIEGNYKGERFYRHAQLGSGERAVPLSPQWAQYVAQFDNLPIDGFTTVRVRFELLGRGQVWIDDLQLYHLRFADAERMELFKLATSAQLKLKDNQYGDCLRLLEGYWPQFLIAQVPLTESPIAQRPVERQAALPEPKSTKPLERSGTLLEQLRGWVPKWR